jgi:hypothetical protein
LLSVRIVSRDISARKNRIEGNNVDAYICAAEFIEKFLNGSRHIERSCDACSCDHAVAQGINTKMHMRVDDAGLKNQTAAVDGRAG